MKNVSGDKIHRIYIGIYSDIFHLHTNILYNISNIQDQHYRSIPKKKANFLINNFSKIFWDTF